MMGSRHNKKRTKVESDRLSSLPDDLIHKILSLNGLKCAIGTSVLSSRWRYMWTTMLCLNFSTEDFSTLRTFSKFVTHVLSKRNNEIEVSSLRLSFHGKVNQIEVKKILNYAFSHNVQQLDVVWKFGHECEFPLSLFSCQSLKRLSLTGERRVGYWKSEDAYFIIPTSSWELPALTTLHLCYIDLCDNDVFIRHLSKCPNLKNLSLKSCKIMGLNSLSVCHPVLFNLTLEEDKKSCYKRQFIESVNVVAPQLKNLTIRNWNGKLLISAPKLASFHYEDRYPSELSTNYFRSLEKVDLCITFPLKNLDSARKLVSLLQHLHCVKFLTINLEIVEVLSLYVELISHQPSPFTNLKTLKIYPEKQEPNDVNVSSEVRNYLLDSSPTATFTLISREDVSAMRNATSARSLMKELEMLLEECKENSKINTTHMEHEKVENQTKMGQTESYWKDLNEPFLEGYTKTSTIIAMLRKIETLLTNVPISQRAEMQARYSSVYAEAETIMDNMIDCMKIQCNKKPRHINLNKHPPPSF